jgi:hypothetical protein
MGEKETGEEEGRGEENRRKRVRRNTEALCKKTQKNSIRAAGARERERKYRALFVQRSSGA